MARHLAHHLDVANLEREDVARELGPNSTREAAWHARSTGRKPKHLAEPTPDAAAEDLADVERWAIVTAVTEPSGRAA